MGLIGENRKFYSSTSCSVQKHENNKFPSAKGLCIRVPTRPEQCFTSPFLADKYLDVQLLELFLTAEKSVEEWSSIFAQITATNAKFTSESWAAMEAVRLRAKAFQTLKKLSTVAPDIRKRFQNLNIELEDIKIAVDDSLEGKCPNFETRISTLEMQIKHLGKSLLNGLRLKQMKWTRFRTMSKQ